MRSRGDTNRPYRLKVFLLRRRVLLACLVLSLIGLAAASPWLWLKVRIARWSYLLESTDSEFSSTPVRSADFLVEIGSPALPALKKALENRKPYVRHAVVWAVRLMKDDRDEVLAMLHPVAREDPETYVRVEAGWSLLVLGCPSEAMPCLAQALELEPFEHGHTMKLTLAEQFRIREAVESVIWDCEDYKPYCVSSGFRHLKQIAGEDIDGLPRLKNFDSKTRRHLPRSERLAIIAEFKQWWEEHKEEYHSLEDLLAGKVPLPERWVRPGTSGDTNHQ